MIPPFSKPFSAPFVKPFGAEELFTPLDVPNLQAWYDATDADSIASSGGFVDSWADKSGNGNTVVQSGTTRPTTGVQTINSLNAIGFDGINDFLRKTFFTTTPNFTIIFVFNVVAVFDSNDSVVSFNDNLAGNNDFQIDANSINLFLADFNSNALGNITGIQNGDVVGKPVVYMYRLSTGDNSVRLFDATFEIASDEGGYTTDLSTNMDFVIGANRVISQFLEVNVGEIVIVNRDVTTQERIDLFNYFARWGV